MIRRLERQAEWEAPRPRHVLTMYSEILSDGTHSDVLSGNASSRFGFAVGGGVEYAFTDYLTLKAEYLFYDLGT